MMRALVLGGSVFVGKRLIETLVEAGVETAALNRGRTAPALPAGVEHLRADRTDPASMRAALAGRDWDAVYDVSGFVMAAGGGDIENLLDLLDGRTGTYVFVSSIMAYDQSLVGLLPWSEDMPDNQTGPTTYGGFKAVAERAVLARHAARGFPGSIVRPAAIYGPDNNIFDMETAMFLRLEQGRPILLPHSGLVSASYGHVDDLCRLMVTMTDVPAAAGQIFNATAEAVTARHYVEALAAIVGVAPDIVELPDDMTASLAAPVFGHLFGIKHHAVLTTDKARSVLGFTPEHDFDGGHRHTYAWFREQGWSGRSDPLVDTVWGATWDFDAEAAVAGRVR